MMQGEYGNLTKADEYLLETHRELHKNSTQLDFNQKRALSQHTRYSH